MKDCTSSSWDVEDFAEEEGNRLKKLLAMEIGPDSSSRLTPVDCRLPSVSFLLPNNPVVGEERRRYRTVSK